MRAAGWSLPQPKSASWPVRCVMERLARRTTLGGDTGDPPRAGKGPDPGAEALHNPSFRRPCSVDDDDDRLRAAPCRLYLLLVRVAAN
jgi:hypothetical protein